MSAFGHSPVREVQREKLPRASPHEIHFPPPEPILSGLAKAKRRGSNSSSSSQGSGVTTTASSSLDDSEYPVGVGEKAFPTSCDPSIGIRFGMNIRTEDGADIVSEHIRTLSSESVMSSTRSSLTAAMLVTHEGEQNSFPLREKKKIEPVAPQISHSGQFDFFLDLDDHSGSNNLDTFEGVVLDNHGHHPMSLTAHDLPHGNDNRLRARTLSACSKNFEAYEHEDLMFDLELN